ncbi:LysR family transcriptional regulator [Marinobacter sp. ATCH36]|uniref:LysR family transcriptional regulator n=1 Tax=Marinobacter sp. ATCH36 TaxID=2945106 RepID=UPI0020215B07|nr:LysR family transcriptional regulator [Marinobacter sp. ATCH36]MCL7943644.1 LysR family transcriptional regulator [Marinobacter sp. ATCH36]
MNNLQQILTFVTAAQHAGFARAARELGQSASTVAKSIARLEEGLGVKLFYRTTRQVSLTPDGQNLFAHCQRILAEVESLEAMAAGVRGEPEGTLRIDMPLSYGKRMVLPVLAALQTRHPKLSIDARLSDRYSDIILDGLDAVIRIGELSDSGLVARRFDQQQLVVCGSPDYFMRKGLPESPYALEHHECLLFRVPTSGRDRPWEFTVDGVKLRTDPRSRFRLGDGEALIDAAIAGLGLIQVPDYMAVDAVADGRLKEVLEIFRPSALPISVVYPSARMLPPRVRVLIDALVSNGTPGGKTGTDLFSRRRLLPLHCGPIKPC